MKFAVAVTILSYIIYWRCVNDFRYHLVHVYSNVIDRRNVTAQKGRLTSKLNLQDGSRLIFSQPISCFSFLYLTFPGSPYRIFLQYLCRIPCYFYPTVIEQQPARS